jgi:hypothetical protein
VIRRFTLGLLLVAALGLSGARSLEVVTVRPDADAIDLSGAFEPHEAESNGRLAITTAPGPDGKTDRILVRSSSGSTHWAVLALANKGDKQLERLLVAASAEPSGFSLLFPTRAERRILSVTASAGSPPRHIAANGDVFALTLDPGSVITYVLELRTAELPSLLLWKGDAYERHQAEATTFQDRLSAVIAVVLAILLLILLRVLRRARRSGT